MIEVHCDTDRIKGDITFDHPMSQMNTWRIGGKAECFFEPSDVQDLAFFLAECRGDLPVTFLGLGSNVLIRDGGIKGIVITLRKGFKAIEAIDEHKIKAEAGVACGSLARYCLAQNMHGLEFFAGIPGTVGGALKMNAGAFGSSTWDYVSNVETIDIAGKIYQQDPSEFKASYRSVEMPPDRWFIAAEFSLQEAQDNKRLRDELNQKLYQRNASQPVGKPSCGSVFKNPPDTHAAALIEECGLKAHSIGGAKVSEKHANFIINLGDASAQDVEDLIIHVQRVVKEKRDVDLKPEVVIVGEAS